MIVSKEVKDVLARLVAKGYDKQDLHDLVTAAFTNGTEVAFDLFEGVFTSVVNNTETR